MSLTAADVGRLYGLALNVAVGMEYALCAKMLEACHYLHTFPDPRCMPLVYSVRLRGEWVGTLVFGRPESNRCYQGELTYGSVDDLRSGRVKYDRWEVLNLARVWLSPDVQFGGRLCDPDVVPGFTDRKGVFRPTTASAAVQFGLREIRRDYLLLYPPCFVEEPYQIRAVLSYCDRRVHRGTLYRASGFSLARVNRAGVETWCRGDLPPLNRDEDAEVRAASRTSGRSQRKRAARGEAEAPRQRFIF